MKTFLYPIILSITALSYPLSYQHMQHLLKEECCYGQQSLRDNDEYYEIFFDESLFEMERIGLGVPIACRTRTDVSDALNYFKMLPVLNIAIYLTHFAHLDDADNEYVQIEFINLKDQLLATIENIKRAWQLDDLDPKQELDQIVELLYVSQVIAYMAMYDDVAVLMDLFTSDQFLQKIVARLHNNF